MLNKLTICLLTITAIFLLSINTVRASDTDQDGLSDEEEINIYQTDPAITDSDNDGFADGQEIKNGYSPLQKNKKLQEVDSDSDGLQDDWEIKIGTNLNNKDSDNDGYSDGTEITSGFDPLSVEGKLVAKKIQVDLKKQQLEYFFNNIKLDSFLISSGVAKMPTPKGDFTILEKVPTKHYAGANFNYPNTRWNLHFTTGKYRYYIHGAYWHNKFGQPMSHGCVNVSYANMERLYNWADKNTKVKIY
ncbi:MAG: hypothetical protein COX77_02180 [Candidatus Komeilibacteria bacterium CG_4_10_14_0_2_um_filter_37_10]|uniref:L,D-TPase catalytic domain-containing protein n=1 Tax=Candidatus Komeilibacteria bacterium CG_4_10_14_0_2_um_filter_37_10 TaxID=1974470 RepID=A0A2M7VFJ6_9BACT|nr:MAG: hypothetical protein COX77_02180 [Candidatus Komeilibacteria bacterium CG_4_10_14_0_2_um_filter_37_10]